MAAGAIAIGSPQREGGTFDPIALHELAVHLRDQKWLDMHVDDERGQLVKRVRLTAVIVRVTDELVCCRQEWVDDQEDGSPRFNHHDLVFDADAVWRVTSPTQFRDIDGLRPYGFEDFRVARSKPAEECEREITHSQPTDGDRLIFDHICTHVASAYGCTPSDISTKRSGVRWAQARYDAMLLLHDMTQLTDMAVAYLFGYQSITPFFSARYEVRLPTGNWATDEHRLKVLKRCSAIRKIAQKIDRTLGSRRSRREPADRLEVL